jgi:uncharacterized YccA/Bax inhibitor family protein
MTPEGQMAIKNPVFSRIEQEQKQGGYATFRTTPASPSVGTPSADDLQNMYAGPSATTADTGRLTYDDVIMKTAAQFVLLLAGAAVSWRYVSGLGVDQQGRGLALTFGAMIAAFAVYFVVLLKKSISPPLILAYALLEGLFIGAISQYYNDAYNGVVGQAVIGTLGAFAAMLAAYKFGLIKVNDKFRRIARIAILGYIVVGIASFIAALAGVGGGFGFYGAGPLGIVLCLAGVTLASISLVLNFDTIDTMVKQGAPAKTSWILGFGLVVTLVWLYIELLRLLSILRQN